MFFIFFIKIFWFNVMLWEFFEFYLFRFIMVFCCLLLFNRYFVGFFDYSVSFWVWEFRGWWVKFIIDILWNVSL